MCYHCYMDIEKIPKSVRLFFTVAATLYLLITAVLLGVVILYQSVNIGMAWICFIPLLPSIAIGTHIVIQWIHERLELL